MSITEPVCRDLRAADGATIGMGSVVRYAELPSGAQRTIVLVHPADANPSEGRVSLFSPFGRALLGRAAAPATEVIVPTWPRTRLTIISVQGQARATRVS